MSDFKNIHGYKIIVIGASTGGLDALKVVLSGLPAWFEVPVVIVLHRERDGADHLTRLLQAVCHMPVLEVEDKQAIEPGHVYLAPRNYHVLMGPNAFELTTDAAIYFARPSIDMLFESAANTFGRDTIGVVLTGANEDGANGQRAIKQAGGLTLAQDPTSAEDGTMPRATIRSTPVDQVLPLQQIAQALIDHVTPTATKGEAS